MIEKEEGDNMAYREYLLDYWGDKEKIIGTFGAKWMSDNTFDTGIRNDYWSVDVGYHPETDIGLVFFEGYQTSKLIMMGDESKMEGLAKIIKDSAKSELKIRRKEQD